LVHYNSHGLVSFKVCAQQQQRPSSSADNIDDEISSPAVFPSLQEESGGNGAEGGQGRDKTGNTRGDLSKLRYGLVTGLAAVGLAETSYLTWVKLYGGAVSCPTDGATCSDVLNSDYAMVFGEALGSLSPWLAMRGDLLSI
jgi:hypothetical protein